MPELEQPADLTGRTLGDFQILRRLGAGGMGQVYLARQLSLKREVALKLLHDNLAANEKALLRFQAEAEAVARISHPNIVQVYAIGEHEGLRFMALEYVNGRNLRDYLVRKGPPDLPVALTILKQVAAALQKAAELGIVHRDVKPENILLTKKAEVKVTDFGLSRLTAANDVPLNLTQSGMTLGTPLYMAPEQVQGKATDHRSDLYSFGVTAFHLLAGEPPFSGKTGYEVAMKHVTALPPSLASLRPDLPPDLIALVHKLIAKDPAERYTNAKDVARDLAKIQKGLALNLPEPVTGSQPVAHSNYFGVSTTLGGPVPSGPTLAFSTIRPPSPWPARILGILATAALSAGGWKLYAWRQPKPESPAVQSGPGLPDLALPETLAPQTQKERELLAKIENRQTPAAEHLNASIDLGLHYVREHRYDSAKKIFDDLEKERSDSRGPLPKGLGGPSPQTLAAKFGQAIVMAQQDKADDSVKAFQEAVNLGARAPAYLQMHKFLIDHADLSLAITEALYRNQENWKTKKLPVQLDWLRTPGSIIRGREIKT